MKQNSTTNAYVKNAKIYRLFANSKRLQILDLLKDGEMPVEKILKITKLAKANLSQHLTLLRLNGLIKKRKEGLYMFYTLVDPRIVDPCKVFQALKDKKVLS